MSSTFSPLNATEYVRERERERVRGEEITRRALSRQKQAQSAADRRREEQEIIRLTHLIKRLTHPLTKYFEKMAEAEKAEKEDVECLN
jgi:hypothetical protein